MKFISYLAILFYFGQAQNVYSPKHGVPPANPPKTRSIQPIWGKITQKQDNFDTKNSNTFQMRYISNSQFFKPGGPIFIMLGAEWTIDEGWLQNGQMYDMAKIHNAFMFYTEHRYYGKSFPTSNLSSENLQYLSVDQALADVANFIVEMKNKNSDLTNSKVVVFGGSYGGTMAIWMREKYPDLVDAAVSSSAPLLAKIDFHEYHEVVQASLGSECASVISNGVNKVLQLLAMGKSEKIQRDFRICSSLENYLEVTNYFMSIASRFGNKIQYANKNTISDICRKLQDNSFLSDYDSLVKYVKDDKYCMPGYDDLIYSMSSTDLYSGNERQWIYQTCTEFGFFQTSWYSTALYNKTIPAEFYERRCSDIFGSSFSPIVTSNGIYKTNTKYRALHPKVTRVISIHGTVDPWHAIGLNKSLNSEAPVYIVPGTSHCSDMYSLSKYDSIEMQNVKLAVRSYIAKWLQE